MARDESFAARNMAAQALGKVRSSEALSDLYHAYRRESILYAQQTMLGSIGNCLEEQQPRERQPTGREPHPPVQSRNVPWTPRAPGDFPARKRG